MLHDHDPLRRRAGFWLTFATVFWGLSFPVMKGLSAVVENVAPGCGSWFATSSTLTMRFGMAGIVMLVWLGRQLSTLTALEVWEGFGLGLFSGIGMLFQMDGLAYTSASTSAFLTQTYCFFLPLLVAWRERSWPPLIILVCTVMVMSGVAILAQFNWTEFKMGRGELETIIGSVVFAGQVLWLDRPLFRENRAVHFSTVMFFTMTAISLIVALGTLQPAEVWRSTITSPSVLLLTGIQTLFCTLIAFNWMNRWQPHIAAPEAALIYAAEPVFASVFALFLPEWISRWTSIQYSNERVTRDLLLGGALISTANVLLQLRDVGPAKK